MDATLDRFGKLDIGVNCTGWGLLKPFLETTREELEQKMSVLLGGRVAKRGARPSSP